MSFLKIDHEKCKCNGICVEVCPLGLIRKRQHSTIPSAVFHAEKFCIGCGHCVAICPYGALSTTTIAPEQCQPVRKEWLLTPEQTEHFLRCRRSIRVYKDKAVDKETLSRLIEIARFAPSAHNSQPVEWMVIYNPADVQKMAGLVVDWMRHFVKDQPDFANRLQLEMVIDKWESGQDQICRKAPHIILAHAPKENQFALNAATIALAYLELAAPAFGLGACWAGFFNLAASFWPPMRQALKLPGDNLCLGALMVGYPKYTYSLLPPRKEPKILWR